MLISGPDSTVSIPISPSTSSSPSDVTISPGKYNAAVEAVVVSPAGGFACTLLVAIDFESHTAMGVLWGPITNGW